MRRFPRCAGGWPLAALAAIGALPSPGVAQSEVRGRTATRIELQADRSGEDLRVSGRLLDSLGGAVSDAIVILDASDVAGSTGRRRSLTTDAAGAFAASFADAPSDARLVAAYPGDELHDATERSVVAAPGFGSVRLTWLAPGGARLDVDAPAHEIAVRAESAAGGAGLAVEIRDELGRSLGRGRTDERGRFATSLPGGALGAPGVGALLAHSDGDGTRAEARAERAIVRFRASRVEATATRRGADIEIAGVLSDTTARLGHRAIGLFESDVHLATTWTRPDGSFVFRRPVPASLADRAWEVRFDSETPWLGSSRSGALTLAVLSGAYAHRAYLAASLALAVLLVALTRRPRASKIRETSAPGVRRGRYRPRWARATYLHVSGHAVDACRGTALGAARAELRPPAGAPVVLDVDDEGGFISDPLAPGRWTLRVEAVGYAPVETHLHVPHNGEWLHLRAQLDGLRAAAAERYRGLAHTLLPRPALWNVWSEREILAHWRAADGPRFSDLARLTDRVEQACYGPTPPRMEEVDAIARDAQSLLRDIRRESVNHETHVDAPRGPFL